MALTVKHAKTVTIPDPTQAELDAQIALGNYPPGTTLADISLQSDWNDDHPVSGTLEQEQNDVAVDGVTVAGNGTPANPLVANIITDHGALSGLSDDDHTQYLLANGTRALSANWDAGAFNITCSISKPSTLELRASSAQIVFDSTAAQTTTLQDSAATTSKTITLPNATGTLATLANITQAFAGATSFARPVTLNDTTAPLTMASSGGGSGALAMPSTISAFTYTMPGGTTTLTGNSIANTFSQNQTISKATPKLIFTDSGGDDYEIGVTAGVFAIRNTTDGRDDLSIGAGGELTLGASGTNLGFYGTTPVARSTGWTTSNVTTDKVLDANSTTLDEVADVLCTLIETLKTNGLLGA